MFDRDDGDGEAELKEQHASDRVPDSSAVAEPEAADEMTIEEVAEAEPDCSQREPQSTLEPAVAEMTDNNDANPLDSEARMVIGHPDLEASMADVGEQRQNEAEAQIADPPVQVESEAATSGAPLICKLGGCRYSGCQGQGRCLAH
jgi:hypothetical protein